MDADAARARMLLEESREAVVVVDGDDRVLVASRRARESIQGLEEGAKLPDGLLRVSPPGYHSFTSRRPRGQPRVPTIRETA